VKLDVQRCVEFLTSEGYRPTVDGDRFVLFMHEGGLYYVELDPLDPQYVRVVYPGFWAFAGEDEHLRVLAAAATATLGTKAAKVVVIPDRSKVAATVEMFVPTAVHFEAVFARCLAGLQAAVACFVREMRPRPVDASTPGAMASRYGGCSGPN
jgi:hypothetical protein